MKYTAEQVRNGKTIALNDTVVVNDTKSFTIVGIEVQVSPVNSEVSCYFTLDYNCDGRNGTDKIESRHLSKWL